MSQLYVNNIKSRVGGAVSFTQGIVSAGATFSGNVSVGGTLTYEDVTNIDSVGVITARTGVRISAGGLVVAGVSTLAADLSIADKIIHTGDTNTAIRFPAADTFTVETAGSERLRVDSTGDVRFAGTNLTNNTNKSVNLTVPSYNTSEEDVNLIQVENESGSNQITFGGGTSALNAATTLRFLTASAVNTTTGTERLRITSAGNLISTGTISDSIGPLRRLGVNAQSGAYAFVVGDAGKIIRSAGSGAALTLNQNIFTAGDMISVFNVGSGTNTVVQGTGVTLYNTADAATGTRTIAAKGMVTIVCTASNEFAISGSQLT